MYAVRTTWLIRDNRDGICGTRSSRSVMRYVTVEGAVAAAMIEERKHSYWSEVSNRWVCDDEVSFCAIDATTGKVVRIQEGWNQSLVKGSASNLDSTGMVDDELPF